MGYCQKCGARLKDGAAFCTECGAAQFSEGPDGTAYQAAGTPLQVTQPAGSATEKEKGSFGWAVLGFLVPLVGLILYLVWKDDRPGDSLMAGKGALASVIAGAALALLDMLASCALVGCVAVYG